MAFFTHPVKEDQCLFLTYKGNSPMNEMMSARQVANRYLTAKRWKRIVVDMTGLQSMPRMMEVIGLASDLSSELPTDVRIALIVAREQAEHARLAERVARIEGIQLNYFFDLGKAKAWVKGTAGDSQVNIPGTTATKHRH